MKRNGNADRAAVGVGSYEKQRYIYIFIHQNMIERTEQKEEWERRSCEFPCDSNPD